MNWLQRPWVRNIGIPTAIYTIVFSGPWLVIPFIGLRFLALPLVITPPLWWWLVRGRTDQPVRGAFAGLLIGPLVHLGEFWVLVLIANGPSNRDGGLANLIWIYFAFGVIVAGVASFALSPLLGTGIVYLLRRWPRPAPAASATPAA